RERRRRGGYAMVGHRSACSGSACVSLRTGALAQQRRERVIPMKLQVGDRISGESGEWAVVAHPYMGAGGKIAYARVRRVDQPAVVDVQSWSAHERISVKRT